MVVALLRRRYDIASHPRGLQSALRVPNRCGSTEGESSASRCPRKFHAERDSRCCVLLKRNPPPGGCACSTSSRFLATSSNSCSRWQSHSGSARWRFVHSISTADSEGGDSTAALAKCAEWHRHTNARAGSPQIIDRLFAHNTLVSMCTTPISMEQFNWCGCSFGYHACASFNALTRAVGCRNDRRS